MLSDKHLLLLVTKVPALASSELHGGASSPLKARKSPYNLTSVGVT